MAAGKRIAELRALSGMSQQELADRLFVSRTTVAKWESGSRNPDMRSVRALSSLFGVDPESIVSYDGSLIAELSRCIPRGAEIPEGALPSLLNEFLPTLPKNERAVFVRRYHFLEKPSEIAERLGMPGGNVRIILWRARGKLKEYLGNTESARKGETKE